MITDDKTAEGLAKRSGQSLSEEASQREQIEVVLPSREARTAAYREATAVVVFTWVAFTKLALLGFEITDLAWAAFIGFGLFWGLIQIRSRMRASSTRLLFGDDYVSEYRGERLESRTRYENVSAVELRTKGCEGWMRVTELDGSTHSWPYFPISDRKDNAHLRVVQALGPKLNANTEFNRGVRPSDPFEQFRWDRFYALPAVPMQAGVIYRYRFRTDLEARFLRGDLGWAWPMYMLPTVVSSHSLEYFLIFLPLLAGSLLYRGLPMLRLKKSLGDRFRLTPEGLEVMRPGQPTRVLRRRPQTRYQPRVSWMYGAVECYGPWGKAYYIDPRFIEPDR